MLQLSTDIKIHFIPSLKTDSLQIYYGKVNTLQGNIFFAFIENVLCSLHFRAQNTEQQYLKEMQKKYPNYILNSHKIESNNWLENQLNKQSLVIFLKGTAFQQKVWLELLKIPQGKTISYSELAMKIGSPTAHRAVANAVGQNPIAYFVPCHRVIRESNELGGYRWGLSLKKRLLVEEGLIF